MACVNMFNNEALYTNSTMTTPRISFSNDFADPMKLENSYREAPVSSDFAFSAPNYSMISADELFCKGKIVPLRENCTKINTLRDELLCGDDDLSPRLAKGTSSWKQRLGLRRSHVVPKKSDKMMMRTNDGSNLESIDEMKIQDIIDDEDNFKGFL
ncbi:hypothetical protein ACS0TY_002581 [Phlomoides rotata]